MINLTGGHQAQASDRDKAWTIAWPISLTIHMSAFILLYFVFTGTSDPLGQASVIREVRFVEPSPALEDRPVIRSGAAPSLGSLLEAPTTERLALPSMGAQLTAGPSVIGLSANQGRSGASAVFSTLPRQSPPEVIFFGSSANGYKIVFVVDRSGSMWDQFALVRDELLAALARLEPSQQFQLIFFSSGTPVLMKPAVFLDASAANRQAAYDFLQQIASLDPASGPTDPAPALRAALILPRGPADVIFLLSDGDFPETLLATVKQVNPQGHTQVNTIGFGYKGGSKLLRDLAVYNHGSFRFVQTAKPSEQTKSSLDTLLH